MTMTFPSRTHDLHWSGFLRPGLLLSLALTALVGCEQSSQPQFRLNMVKMVSSDTSPAYQQEIADVMAGMFGTPDEPFAPADSGLDQKRLELAAGSAWSDADGVNHGLYRKHCVHCHGVSGDGRGPTAKFLNPYPRDYRQGVFKFKSTFNAAKPTDEDLRRVLWNGAPGTSMPSFSLLPQSELESLVEYVKYLSIRGEMEQQLAQYVFDELGEEEVEGEDGETKIERIALDPANDADQAAAIKDILATVLAPWQEAADQVIVPDEGQLPADARTADEIAASVKKGRDLFYGERANCVKCHGPTGLGDGQQTDFDNWNKENKEFLDATAQLAESIARRRSEGGSDEDAAKRMVEDAKQLSARQAVADTLYPIRNAIPRNLRKGVYRGGRRRIDIYHRIHAGIAGTPMPGGGPTSPGGQGTLTDAEIWNIVDYVLTLPYEATSVPQRALPANEILIAK